MDRFIPCALPYIKIYDGECHHPTRYDNKQKLGLVILNDKNFDKEAYDLTVNVFDRFSRNMHATGLFSTYVKAEGKSIIQNKCLKSEDKASIAKLNCCQGICYLL